MRVAASLMAAGKLRGSLFVSRGDAAELFEFVEETFDQIALAIDRCAEGKAGPCGSGCRNVGPSPSLLGQVSQGVGVVGAVGKEGRASRMSCSVGSAICRGFVVFEVSPACQDYPQGVALERCQRDFWVLPVCRLNGFFGRKNWRG
jgi:hypothetical protein